MKEQQEIHSQQPNKNSKQKQYVKLPTIHQKASFNQIYIKGKRPFPVYIKHAKKVFEKSNILFIHGMTSTIVKALKLAQILRKQFPYLKYKIESDSIPTIVKDQTNEQYQLRQRSCIHIKLEKNFTQDKKQKQ